MTWVSPDSRLGALVREQAKKNIESDTWPVGEEANVIVPGAKTKETPPDGNTDDGR